MRILLAGDTHCYAPFISRTLYPAAVKVGADAIVQLGDFGFWEHDHHGVQFLDDVNFSAEENGIPIYALHGNHDNWSKIMTDYGEDRDPDGFVIVRDNVFYIPQGHVWTWDGRTMRAFGGAYSIDKSWRLGEEERRQKMLRSKEEYRQRAGRPPQEVPSTAGTLWFPDEEMTDPEFAELMIAYIDEVDVVFSHDKPRSSNPGLTLKNEPLCLPNQDRLQLALLAHRPKFWFHGHLHHPYVDTVPCADDGRTTTVVGLSCDSEAAPRFWQREDAWGVLDVGPDGVTYTDSRTALQQLTGAS